MDRTQLRAKQQLGEAHLGNGANRGILSQWRLAFGRARGQIAIYPATLRLSRLYSWESLSKASGSRFLSVDVFDTVLFRLVAYPSDVFALVCVQLAAEHLLTDSEATEFPRLRRLAEQEARLYIAEPTLDEIYEQSILRKRYGPDVLWAAKNGELATEGRLLRGVPAAARALSAARSQGDEVIFVSDMYLPSSFVHRVLCREGIAMVRERTLVSCEMRASKHKGDAWPVVQSHASAGSTTTHIGDSPYADGAMPRRYGIQSYVTGLASLSARETALRGNAPDQNVEAILSGAARAVRLSPPNDCDNVALWEVAADIAGPLLTAYLLHVLSDARNRKLETLYFVSRDGEILLEVAKALNRRLSFGLKLRYLYGGRRAWQVPAFGLRPERDCTWLWEGTEQPPAIAASRRLGIDGLHVDDVWSVGETTRALKRQDVIRAVLAATEDARDLATDYLSQEGLVGNSRWAVVDVGWSGRQWAALHDLIAESGGQPGGTYMIGYSSAASSHSTPDWIDAWLFDSRVSYSRARKLLWARHLVEIFCTGSEGGLVGYRRLPTNSIVPVLAGHKNTAANSWGLSLMRAAILQVANEVADLSDLFDIGQDSRASLSRAISGLVEHPSKAETEALCKFPYENGMESEGETQDFIVPYNLRSALKLSTGNVGMWPHGSAQLANPIARVPLRVLLLTRGWFSFLYWRLRRG